MKVEVGAVPVVQFTAASQDKPSEDDCVFATMVWPFVVQDAAEGVHAALDSADESKDLETNEPVAFSGYVVVSTTSPPNVSIR